MVCFFCYPTRRCAVSTKCHRSEYSFNRQNVLFLLFQYSTNESNRICNARITCTVNNADVVIVIVYVLWFRGRLTSITLCRSVSTIKQAPKKSHKRIENRCSVKKPVEDYRTMLSVWICKQVSGGCIDVYTYLLML